MDAGRHFVSFEFLVLIAFIMDSNYGFDDFLSGAGATDFSQFFDAGAEDCNDSSFEGADEQIPVEDFMAFLAALNPATSSSDALGASSAPSTPPLDASSSSYAPHPHTFAQQPESAINPTL